MGVRQQFLACPPLGLGNGRAACDKSIFVAALALVNRRADPGFTGDRYAVTDELVPIDQAVEGDAGRPSGQVVAAGVPSQPGENPRDVDAAAARIMPFVAAAYLVSVDDAVDLERRRASG